MTALENVMVGRHVRTRAGVLGRGPARRAPPVPRSARSRDARTELLDYVRARRARRRARAHLPYGDQRRLEIARALATEPRCWPSTSRRPG